MRFQCLRLRYPHLPRENPFIKKILPTHTQGHSEQTDPTNDGIVCAVCVSLFPPTLREEIFAEFIFANLNPIRKNLLRTLFSFSHPQKFIPRNNGVISLFGTNMEEIGDKQKNVLKLSFLFVNGNNFTATSALNLVLYIKKVLISRILVSPFFTFLHFDEVVHVSSRSIICSDGSSWERYDPAIESFSLAS